MRSWSGIRAGFVGGLAAGLTSSLFASLVYFALGHDSAEPLTYLQALGASLSTLGLACVGIGIVAGWLWDLYQRYGGR